MYLGAPPPNDLTFTSLSAPQEHDAHSGIFEAPLQWSALHQPHTLSSTVLPAAAEDQEPISQYVLDGKRQTYVQFAHYRRVGPDHPEATACVADE